MAKAKTATSPPGNAPAGKRPTARGFTLIELLVVMAVLAIAVTAVPVILSGGIGGISLKTSAREVADVLRYARGQAIVRNDEVNFTIDPHTRSYTVAPGSRDGRLAGEPTVRFIPATDREWLKTEEGIRFFPDGSSTGGRIALTDDGRRFDVVVDWLTGHVSIRE